MERGCNGGVKVTFIETQFVTSDAAGFKSLVQRLTGNDATVATAPPLERPRPCRGVDGWRGAAGASATATVGVGLPAAPAPWMDEIEMMMLYETCDLAEMLCVDVGAGGGGCHGGGGRR
uniref:VQ domain-containing protein n=1 Tax=Oryza meridionalis TaxID=40149 RepID=A0A0E0CIM2_9ORYZ